MVEQNDAPKDFSSPAILNATEMTEYERRLKRAARFGVQTSDVIGPQSETPAFQNMDLPVAGQHRIEKLTENISRIKMRQQKFAEEVLPEADTKI